MIRLQRTALLTVPLLIGTTDDGLVSILANQVLYDQIRWDLRDAVWNEAFAEVETLVLNGQRDDLAVRREARQLVETQLAQVTSAADSTAMPHLSIAPASNTSVRASGDK